MLEIIALNWSLARALVRAGGFVCLLPAFGIVGRGLRPRVLLAAVLALVIASVQQSSVGAPQPREMVATVGAELANGLALGFTLRIVLSAVQIVAHLVEQQVGLTSLGDADEESGSAMDRLYQIINLAVFLCLSGHRSVIAALLQVADVPSVPNDPVIWTDAAVRLITASWHLAIQSILPLVISLVTAQLAGGMIARVVPQVGGLAVTVPVHLVVGFILVLLSLASVSVTFGHGVDWALRFIQGL
jgi:flagellar biosynthesis protein FliR